MAMQIRLENLVRLHAALASSLSETGINSCQLNEIFSTHVRAECVKCGMHITGDQIGQIAVLEEDASLSCPKLKRLRLGYCAREGCESYYYAFHLQAHPNIDWAAVIEKAHRFAIALEKVAQQEQKQQRKWKQNWLRNRVAWAMISIVAILLFRFVMVHGHLPFTDKPQKYKIDPASTRSIRN
jgi:hypothetical protein